jgi:hypothetical protein
MRRWLLSALSLGLLLGWSSLAHANAAVKVPPPPPVVAPPPGGPPVAFPGFAPQKVKFVVEVDEKAKDARLIVPMNLMMPAPGAVPLGPPPGGLRGQPPPGFFPPQIPEKPKEKDFGAADSGKLGVPTIMAGVALALALATGGLWLIRRGSGRTVVGILVLAGFLLGATVLFADLAPPFGKGPKAPPPAPPAPVKTTPVPLPAGVEFNDKILIEMAPRGDAVRLIVPKEAVLKKAEGKDEKKPEGKE